MRKRPDSAAEGNLQAAGNRQASAFFTQRLQAVFCAGGFGITSRVVAEGIVVSGQLEVDALLFHLVRGGFVEFDGMFDGVRAGLDAVPQPLAAKRVTGSFLPVTMR